MSTMMLFVSLFAVLPYILMIVVLLEVAKLWQKQLLDTRMGALIAAISLLIPFLGPFIGWYMLAQAKASLNIRPATTSGTETPTNDHPAV